MVYSVAVTSAGQMTLPKALREKFQILSRVSVEEKNGEIVVRREKTAEEELKEILDKIDSSWSTEERKRIMKNPGLTYKKAIEELEKTPEGRAEIEAEYGKGIYA